MTKKDTYINDEIYNNIGQKEKGVIRMTPFEDNEKMTLEKAQYYEIFNKVMSRMEFVRMTLILGIKGFTWKKELETTFDIHPSSIADYKDYMQERGLLITKPFIDLPEVQFLATLRTRHNSFYAQRENITVLALSPLGEEFIKIAMEEISKLVNKRDDLYFQYQQIKKKTEAFSKTVDYILKQENQIGWITLRFPDGEVWERKSLKTKQFENDLKIAEKEFKSELLEKKKQELLKDKCNNNQIQLIEDKISYLTNINDNVDKSKPKVEYNGKYYKNLNFNELQRLSEEEISDKELSLFNKQNDLEAKDKLMQQHNIYVNSKDRLRFYCKGYHNYDLKMVDKNKDEGLDFLDSLSKI